MTDGSDRPSSAPLSPAARDAIARQRDRYPMARSAVLPALWVVQHEVGYLSAEGMSAVAEILDLVPSEVAAVATFYSMYFTRPAGRHHVLVCVNAPCALRGADELVSYIGETLGVPSGGTSADGEFTWEATIECLGGCGYAPMMQVDHHFHEFLTPDRVDAVFDAIRRAPSVPAVQPKRTPRRAVAPPDSAPDAPASGSPASAAPGRRTPPGTRRPRGSEQ